MDRILACIDRSAYLNSVCDHAGWFASDPEVGVEVLHVRETTPTGSALGGEASATALLDHAVSRLREEGVGPITRAQEMGSFIGIASETNATLIVMGKRGDGKESERERLGSGVDAMIRATTTPICLTSKVFLPLHRALVLLDADLAHRAAVEFIVSQARVAALTMDVVVVHFADVDPAPKIEWARSMLLNSRASVYGLQAEGLDQAVARYMESRAADLVVVSRAVIASAPSERIQQIAERGVWGIRTPVLIC